MSNDKKSETKLISNLLWVLYEIKKFNFIYLVLLFFNSIIRGIVPLIPLLITQKIVNLLQIKNVSLKKILLFVFLLVIFEIIQIILSGYMDVYLSNAELKYKVYIESKILKKTSNLDVKKLEDNSIYNLINRVQYDFETGVLGYIKTFTNIISSLITVLSYILVIISYDFRVLIIIIIIPIIGFLASKKLNLKEYDLTKKNTESERKISYIFYLLTNYESFKEIRHYDLFDIFIGKFIGYSNNINKKIISLRNRTMFMYTIINIIESLVDGLFIIRLAIQVYRREILIGGFLLYSGAISNVKQNLLNLFTQTASLYKNSSIVDQIKYFFEIEEEVITSGVVIDKINEIRLIDVSYKYKNSSKFALKNINLTIKKGDKIAILGYNGSGKSTLIKILMGIYHDYEGNIYVNNINLKDINKKIYRKRVSVLFQDYVKYETKLKNNIAIYDNSKEKSIEFMKKVDLLELEDCLEDNLGYQFNNGKQISIGQWQKIAIARTLAKEADFYIFDELNASLDLKSEKKIFESIFKEVNSKIAIYIIHRFNELLRKIDTIIVLNEGIIEEIGSHENLIKNKKIYYELYNIQKNSN